MSDEQFLNRYRIPTARAQWHEYNCGLYFITICTKNRERFFGEIISGQMILSPIGQCVHDHFTNVAN